LLPLGFSIALTVMTAAPSLIIRMKPHCIGSCILVAALQYNIPLLVKLKISTTWEVNCKRSEQLLNIAFQKFFRDKTSTPIICWFPKKAWIVVGVNE